MLTSGLLAARSITERIAALSDCGTANSWRVSTLATAFMGNSLRMNCRPARTPEGGQAPDRAPAGKGDSWVAFVLREDPDGFLVARQFRTLAALGKQRLGAGADRDLVGGGSRRQARPGRSAVHD